MSSSAELKARLEAICIEREHRERETHEEEEWELQRMVEEEEHREEEECARCEQQQADEERKRVEEAEAQRKVEEERVAEEQRTTAEMEGGEGSKEADTATGVTEGTWEQDIARMHADAMAGGSKDDGEEYHAAEGTCWNCQHRKLVCERPE